MTKELITAGTARAFEIQDERFYMMQWRLCYLDYTHYWTPITKVYLIPEITMEWNKLYILVAFDFLPDRDNRQIFKCSEQYDTSHFKEKISLN